MLRGQPQCYGATGAVSRLWRGKQDRIATGLPSTMTPVGEVTGPHDVVPYGFGIAQVAVGWGADPALRSALGADGRLFGSLLFLVGGRVVFANDVAAFEGSANPGGGPIDSNPYGLYGFALGAARIYRVVPGSAPTIVYEGFKTIIDIAFSGNDLYVLEYD